MPTLAQPNSGKTRDELAKMANVSHGTLAKVEKIVADGTPEAARPPSYSRTDEVFHVFPRAPKITRRTEGARLFRNRIPHRAAYNARGGGGKAPPRAPRASDGQSPAPRPEKRLKRKFAGGVFRM